MTTILNQINLTVLTLPLIFEKHIIGFPFTLRRRNLKTQQSPVILDLCLRKTRVGKSHDGIIFERPSRKALFSECFPSTLKRKAGVFKFVRFEERFRKALFSSWISVGRRLNRRNKAVFSNFSGVPCGGGLSIMPF